MGFFSSKKKVPTSVRKWIIGFCAVILGFNPVFLSFVFAGSISNIQVTSENTNTNQKQYPSTRQTNPSIASYGKDGLVAYTDTAGRGSASTRDAATRVAGLCRSTDGGMSYKNCKLMDDQPSWKQSSYVSFIGNGLADGSVVAYNKDGRACYLATALHKTNTTLEQFPVLSCSDDGKNWSSPVAVSTPTSTDRVTACQLSFDPDDSNKLYVACRRDNAADGQFHLSQMMLYTSANGGASFSPSNISPMIDGNVDNQALYYPSAPVVAPDASNPGHKALYVAWGYIANGDHQIYLNKAGSNMLVAHIPCLLRQTVFGGHVQPSIPKVVVSDAGVTHVIAGTCLGFTYQLLDIWSNAQGVFEQDPPHPGLIGASPFETPHNWKALTPSVATALGETPNANDPIGRNLIWTGWPSSSGYIFNRNVTQTGSQVKVAFRAISDLAGGDVYNPRVLSNWLRDRRSNFLVGAVVVPAVQTIALPEFQAEVMVELVKIALSVQSPGQTLSQEQLDAMKDNLLNALTNGTLDNPDQQALFAYIQTLCNTIANGNQALAAACAQAFGQMVPVFQALRSGVDFNSLVALCDAALPGQGTACAQAIQLVGAKLFQSMVGLDPTAPNLTLPQGISAADLQAVWLEMFTSPLAVGNAIYEACKHHFNDPALAQACFELINRAISGVFEKAIQNGGPDSLPVKALSVVRGISTSLDMLATNLESNLQLGHEEALDLAYSIWIGMLSFRHPDQTPFTLAEVCNALGLDPSVCIQSFQTAAQVGLGLFVDGNTDVMALVGQLQQVVASNGIPNPTVVNPTFNDEDFMALMDAAILGSGKASVEIAFSLFPPDAKMVANDYLMTCTLDGSGELGCQAPVQLNSAPGRIDGTMASWNFIEGSANEGTLFPNLYPKPTVSVANLGTVMGVASTSDGTCVAYTDTRNASSCDAVKKLQYSTEQCMGLLTGYLLDLQRVNPQAVNPIPLTWGDCATQFNSLLDEGMPTLDPGPLVDPNAPIRDPNTGLLNLKANVSIQTACGSDFDNADIYVSCVKDTSGQN